MTLKFAIVHIYAEKNRRNISKEIIYAIIHNRYNVNVNI